jgi:hypothetical protein
MPCLALSCLVMHSLVVSKHSPNPNTHTHTGMGYNIQESSSSTVRLGITFDFYAIDTMDYPKLKTLIRQFNELRPQHRILLNQAEDKVRRRFKIRGPH